MHTTLGARCDYSASLALPGCCYAAAVSFPFSSGGPLWGGGAITQRLHCNLLLGEFE